MTAHSRILGRAQESQNDYDFNAKGTDYKLTTYVEVREATGEDGRVLDSILWVEARFSLKQAGATRGVNVGHVYAKKVDKTVLDAGVPVWLSETLTEGAKKDKEIGELSTILQELYDEDGDVHDQIKNMVQEYQDRADSVQHQAIDVKADLKGESILFVDTLLLDGDFRGTGLSKVAMQAFHRLLPRITNGHSYTGTIVLSPAPSGDFRGRSDKTNVQVEQALIRLYEGLGYEVWVKGPEDVEESITVMGLVVEN